jgi:YidC/Oxa1 family membrane protein insertase
MGQLFSRLEQVIGSVLSWYFDLLTPTFSNGTAYGLSIILLTITINLLLFPLTLKQTRATRAFTEIQPKIKKIQAEYKDDPQEMQKQLMAVQKEAGATPGGCLLPLLVQMPIWFALFRVLRTPFVFTMENGQPTTTLDPNAIQPIDPNSALGVSLLHHEPATFLGMHLGTTPAQALQEGFLVALPYLLMMVLMVATQYVQQWHSTYGQERPDQKGAGAQQAITRIMPLFIGFISYNFPAGLVLYWTTSNLFRLGQQVLIFRIDGRPTSPAAAEMKDSAAKSGESSSSPPKKPQQGASNKRRRRKRR